MPASVWPHLMEGLGHWLLSGPLGTLPSLVLESCSVWTAEAPAVFRGQAASQAAQES